MEWMKGVMGKEDEPIEVVTPPEEKPQDFQITEEDINLKNVQPVKYEELNAEAKELLMENVEMQEGVAISMMKPLVEPVGTPPPPQGPGPHQNYQATLTEKLVLHDPNTSHATVGIQAYFKPNRSDGIICTYNTQSGHCGILVRQYGPLEFMTQFVQQPYGVSMLTNADCKLKSSVTTVTHIKQMAWHLSHTQSLWKGFTAGARMKYDIRSNRTSMSGAFRWASPKQDHVWAGDFEDNGGFKLSCVKTLEGISDTNLCASLEVAPDAKESNLWIGFGREYFGGLKVRIVANTMLSLKTNIEATVGRAMRLSYTAFFDPHHRMFKQGVAVDM
eukprot:TRINITY_DN1034_c16_g1_i1.p1 TRINITY_DN1034_c16_g1~~TRINITY_DN1034_c16_g1_i1.p1  ORF type:complete len:343 (+),score=73.39 TRINITY_DN1034_c16_g1_i1:39-1031(+)